MTQTSDLLKQIIEMHGGASAWKQVSHIRIDAESGGTALWRHGQRKALKKFSARINTRRQEVQFAAHGRAFGMYQPSQVSLAPVKGKPPQVRQHPAQGLHQFRRKLYWDKLDLIYVMGNLIWSYVCLPFLIAYRSVHCEALTQWLDGDDCWERLKVDCPDKFTLPSNHQRIYIDANQRIRRVDFIMEALAARPKLALYCEQYQTYSGFQFPARRVFFKREESGYVNTGSSPFLWFNVTAMSFLDERGKAVTAVPKPSKPEVRPRPAPIPSAAPTPAAAELASASNGAPSPPRRDVTKPPPSKAGAFSEPPDELDGPASAQEDEPAATKIMTIPPAETKVMSPDQFRHVRKD